ncbi:hypothetical protein [Kordia jejudonensis]|uniref:hypothetical protein n=1 Tax=Kordia jejudonensis TaxID=1348245 RepID=UPI0006290005|nr:hypothetical protein [Kordia jejudonensis]
MKKQLLILIILASSAKALGQDGEFTTHENGLIYSKLTMSKLSHIVDSLNLQYKYCDLNKVYLAKKQTVAHLIKMTKGDMISAKKDLENQIDFDTFVKKYPQAEIEKDILVIQYQYTNYNDEETIKFSHVDLSGDYGFSISETENLARYQNIKANSWLHSYTSKGQYSSESLKAFYFPKTFTAEPLVEKYATMVGYANCLIDTTTTKFKKDAEQGFYRGLPENWQQLSQNEKSELLAKFRNTKVMGTCSMDSSPREHAANIAVLAAETVNWEIFLRAHLDIMNDRFDRVSDGSYAQAGRKTYIRELEELNINIPDLIFGISLRIENAAKNHYYSSITRTGRALSETKNSAEIESAMIAMIKDTQLDDYNRVLMYFLYRNYIYYLEDEVLKKRNTEKLKDAVTALPEYISTKIIFEEN